MSPLVNPDSLNEEDNPNVGTWCHKLFGSSLAAFWRRDGPNKYSCMNSKNDTESSDQRAVGNKRLRDEKISFLVMRGKTTTGSMGSLLTATLAY